MKYMFCAYGEVEEAVREDGAHAEMATWLRKKLISMRWTLESRYGKVATKRTLEEVDRSDLLDAQKEAVEGSFESLLKKPRLSNSQLAQELLLNPSLKLSKEGLLPGADPIVTKCRDIFDGMYFKSLAGDLQLAPPVYTRVFKHFDGMARDLGLLVEKGGFQYGPGDDVRALLRVREIRVWLQDILDLNMVLHMPSAFKNLRILVDVLCKFRRGLPMRDVLLKQWEVYAAALTNASAAEESLLFCNAMQFVGEMIHTVQLQQANAKLSWIASKFGRAALIGYLGRKYDKMVDKKEVDAASIVDFFRGAYDSVKDNKLFSMEKFREETDATCSRFVAHVMVDFFTTDKDLASVPATFSLDFDRLKAFRYVFNHFVNAQALDSELRTLYSGKCKMAKRVQTILGHFVCGTDGQLLGDLSGNTNEAVKKELLCEFPVSAPSHVIVRKWDSICEPGNAVSRLVRAQLAQDLKKRVVEYFRIGTLVNIVDTDYLALVGYEQFAHLVECMVFYNLKVHADVYKTYLSQAIGF